ncbi:MAG: membrane protein insertase YidC [Acidobacteriota bacterium]
MTQQDDPEMERRLLAAIVVSMAVLFLAPYLLQWWFPPTQDRQPDGEGALVMEAPATAEEAANLPTTQDEGGGRRSGSDISPGPGDGATERFEEPALETVRVQTDVLELEFSNRGGVLRSARSSRFRDAKGAALECLPQELPRGAFPAFGLATPGESTNWNEALFAVERTESVAPGRRCEVVRFYRPFKEAEVEKRFRVCEGSFVLDFEISVRGKVSGEVGVALPAGLGMDPETTLEQFPNLHSVALVNGSLESVAAKDIEEEGEYSYNAASWTGIDSQYFAIVLLPEKPVTVSFQRVGWSNAEEGKKILESAQGIVFDFNRARIFIGPKEEGLLKSVDPSLARLIDYGWFGPLVRPLLICLRWLYRHVGNYGWAIIILTFLINVLLVPLRYKQIVSMRKMSELQPKMRSIQDRYKKMKRDDPRRQQMNAEIMKLYREHGVNPLGGCLPLLIQMPILFAFYRMLAASIELRGAPFILWITDLSKPDPYYITPLVMGATMVWQQKITPTGSTDPAQQKVMMLLPVFFTFLFLNVSSGLAVYFLFSNLFGIAFQVALQKLRPDLSPAHAARRARD